MFKRLLVAAFAAVFVFYAAANSSLKTEVFAQESGSRESQRERTVGAQQAEVIVTLNEQFLNSFLDAIFTNLKAPTFPISITKAAPEVSPPQSSNSFSLAQNPNASCTSAVTLEREMMGVKTAVRFENGRITAPLAFTGTYNTGLLGCVRFQGWADTIINLEFNRERQSLAANVRVSDLHLNGVPTLARGVVVNMVQTAIDQRFNPIEILRTEQLSTRVPVAGANGALRLRAREVKPEILPGSLRLHIIYEFVKAD